MRKRFLFGVGLIFTVLGLWIFPFSGCTEEQKEITTVVRECKSYNLDKRIFSEGDTLVYSVCFHQLLPEKDRYTREQLEKYLKMTAEPLYKEKIQFHLYEVYEGFSYLELGVIDTFDKIPIKKNSTFNFEEYTFMDNPRCLNVYITQDKTNDFLGSAGDFIPDIHCAVQHWVINTSTLPHELMHALGCLHTFEPDITDGYSDETGDLVCDTPSSDNFGKHVNRFCSYTHPQKSEEEVEVLINNIMSNSPSHCRCTVTKGQGKKIKKTTQMNKSLYQTLYTIK